MPKYAANRSISQKLLIQERLRKALPSIEIWYNKGMKRKMSQLESARKRLSVQIRMLKWTELALKRLDRRRDHLEKLLSSVQARKIKRLAQREQEIEKLRLQYLKIEELRKKKVIRPKSHKTKPFFKKVGGMKFIPLGLKCTLYKERAERFGCKVNDFTEAQARKLLDTSPTICPLCNKPFDNTLREARKSLDHFIPLSKGGNNTESNVWVVCYSCNTKKRASILKISPHL